MKKLGCKVRFNKDAIDVYGCRVKKYNYLTDIKDLKEGDLVVVHARNDFALGYFVEYCDITETPETKWITDKVDTTKHFKRIENKKRVEEIKTKLEIERKKVEELQVYEILAERNPEMKSLLEELKGLI